MEAQGWRALSATRQFARGAVSIAVMATSCAASGAMFSLEVIHFSLLIVLVMSPATILFLVIERFGSAKDNPKHVVYFAYIGLWIVFFTYAYKTSVEGSEIALAAMVFITAAAISGYAALVASLPVSLRNVLIAIALAAMMLGFSAFVASKV
jgi:hypothetical protein